jgi:hypothetical protein
MEHPMTNTPENNQDWFVIVSGTRVFCGMRPSGTLMWEERITEDPILPVLFPTQPDLTDIDGLPPTATIIHFHNL